MWILECGAGVQISVATTISDSLHPPELSQPKCPTRGVKNEWNPAKQRGRIKCESDFPNLHTDTFKLRLNAITVDIINDVDNRDIVSSEIGTN